MVQVTNLVHFLTPKWYFGWVCVFLKKVFTVLNATFLVVTPFVFWVGIWAASQVRSEDHFCYHYDFTWWFEHTHKSRDIWEENHTKMRRYIHTFYRLLKWFYENPSIFAQAMKIRILKIFQAPPKMALFSPLSDTKEFCSQKICNKRQITG